MDILYRLGRATANEVITELQDDKHSSTVRTQLRVLEEKGHLRHDGGIVDAPGMYVLGLPVLRRRKSSFIHGTEDDVREIGAHLNAFLRHSARAHFRHALARCAEA